MPKKYARRIPKDQRYFEHNNMKLENIGTSLFGIRYHKAVDRSDMQFWHELYLRIFQVLQASALQSTGSMDPSHRKDIEREIQYAISMLKTTKARDETNAAVIAALFDLVFLLLGRRPYRERGKFRHWSTFRTLTYSQTEEQLSYLLQGYMQRNSREHGFDDQFEADMAYSKWARSRKRSTKDRSAYCEWVRELFPDTYALFR